MTGPDPLAIAAHIDRIRRQHAARQIDYDAHNLPDGWLGAKPGGDDSEFPSTSLDRVNWVNLRRKLAAADLTAARAAAGSIGLKRIYIWLAPWACDRDVETLLSEAGAVSPPYMHYLTLSRAARAFAPDRPSPLTVRLLTPGDAGPVLSQTIGWYATPDTLRSAELGHAEFFAAFDGDRPVAVAQLKVDGDFAYVGGATTHPEFRGRGAQTLLIAARTARAESAGARWCISETNTAVPISLNNLLRCGFTPAIRWRVFTWSFGSAS